MIFISVEFYFFATSAHAYCIIGCQLHFFPCSSHLEGKVIPLGDRHIAMTLLFELALQRGTLSHILDAILLLLHLSAMPPSSTVKNKRLSKSSQEEGKEEEFLLSGGGAGGRGEEEGSEVGFPLVPFLRRLSTIPTPQSPYPSLKGVQEV